MKSIRVKLFSGSFATIALDHIAYIDDDKASVGVNGIELTLDPDSFKQAKPIIEGHLGLPVEPEPYRYRMVCAPSRVYRLRDDGYRIEVQIISLPQEELPQKHDEWILWAEYKYCDLPDMGEAIATALMEHK